MTDDRLTALEARVAALEAALRPDAAPSPPTADAGAVGYGGDVSLAGSVRWRIDYSAAAITGMPADRLAGVLAALGHPARIEITQWLLRGPRSATELLDLVDGASKGQLYHHLSTLSAAGIIDKGPRGQYAVGPQKVVPALVAMLCAADIGGLLTLP